VNDIFEVAEGAREQSSKETKVYSITTTNLESAPTSPTATVYDESDNDTDVTATVMPSGSNSASGDVITLKPLTALTARHNYRIEVVFTVGSNIHNRYLLIKCPK